LLLCLLETSRAKGAGGLLDACVAILLTKRFGCERRVVLGGFYAVTRRADCRAILKAVILGVRIENYMIELNASA
jgi:hypothetical protein